jgi:O-antigen/teichoic acid export membrane protein
MIKEFLKFSFGSWVSAVISFFTVPIITLLINPEQFGKASMFILTYGILFQFILFGTDQSFLRFFYEYGENKGGTLLWNAIFPSIVVWGGLTISIFFCWEWISIWLISEQQVLIVGLLCIYLLIGIFSRYAFLVVRMKKKSIFFSLTQIIATIINVVVIIFYSKYISNTFYAIVWGGICSQLITTIISLIKERNFWFVRWSISKQQISAILKYGLPFIPTCLMAMLFEGMDKIFIRKFVGFEGLGLYSVAFKIVAALSILQTGFSTFWIPTSYEYYEKYPNEKTLYEKTFKYVSFILVFCGLSLIAVKDIVVLLFNKTYVEAASVMPFLVFIPIMYILSEITNLGINFTKKTYWHIVIFGVLLLLCPLFNFIFVPRLGINGAALSVALSYLCYFTLRTIISVRLFPMRFCLRKMAVLFLLLFVVAGINTFCDKKIGITCAGLGILICLLFHISTIKDIFIYFRRKFI